MDNRDLEWARRTALTEDERVLRQYVDIATREVGIGPLSQSYTNLMMGFDHRFAGIPLPVSTESRGMVFFTRPRMNLSYDNVAQDRMLTHLLSNDEKSMSRAIRVLLDPRGTAVDSNNQSSAGDNTRDVNVPSPVHGPVRSLLVDNRSPFIPVLSNALISMSGWPDIVAEYFSSNPGIAKETWFQYDGPRRYFGEYQLNASWRNLPGDPITSLLQAWITYGLNVYHGLMLPYPEAIIEREIDYQTRIYHFVLDPSRRFVQKLAVASVCAPVSAGIAAQFNFSTDSPLAQESMKQVSIQWVCTGVEYNDPINIDEFNRLQAHFNPDMRTLDSREREMVQLSIEDINYFNFYGYPYIDPYSMEFQWWVYRRHYQQITNREDSSDPTPANFSGSAYI